MTLVEVLVAGVILLLTMIPMGIFLANATTAAAQTRQRQTAVQLADTWVEILGNTQPPTRNDGAVYTGYTFSNPSTSSYFNFQGVQVPPASVGGTTYTVDATYLAEAANDLSGSDLCTSGEPPSPSHPAVIELLVTIIWDNGRQTVSDSTEINYPKPGLQIDGFLAINMTNNLQPDVNGVAASTRLMTVPVTITQVSGSPVLNPSSFPVNADTNGCIFVQVPPGEYTVSITQPAAGSFTDYTGSPAFVTPSGSITETLTNQAVSVTAEQVVPLQPFDEGIIGKVAYGGSAAVDSGVECPGAAAITCVTTGTRTSGGSSAWGGAGATWTTAKLSTVTRVKQVACTTATSATCVGVGFGPAGGAILSTSTNFAATTTDTVPGGVTDISQVTCPGTDGCYALGTTASGPALLAGYVGPGSDVWSNVTPGSVPFASMNSIACPTATTCELTYTSTTGTPGVLRLDGNSSGLAVNPAWVPTVTADVLPPTVTAIGTIVCPAAADCEATATGDFNSPSDATVVTGPIAGSGATTWTNESTFPTGATTVTGISCTSTSCVAIGSVPGTPAVWTGDLTTPTHAWSQANTFPSSVGEVSSVACGQPSTGDTADCLVAGTSTGTSGSGLLVDGSLTAGTWAWNFVSPPSGTTVQFYDDVACENPVSSTGSTCAAVGSTLAGPVVLASSSGPAGSWANVTPASFPGGKVSGIPIETAPAGTTSWTPQVNWGSSNVTQLPYVLYPQPSGYTVVAADCPTEGPGEPAGNLPAGTLVAAAGGTGTTTLPLGLLPLQLVNSSGAPVSGASIILTSTTNCGSGYDYYDLPTTDGYGQSVISVPYGTYSYTVTIGGTSIAHTTATLSVGPSSVVETVNGSPTTYYLPTPVPVPA